MFIIISGLAWILH